jgi:tetratricopeptide (TPR) repeat protein
MALVAIRDRVVDVESAVETLLSELDAEHARLPPEAVFQLRNLLAARLLRRGHTDEAAKEYRTMGCLRNWSGAGPFGPKPFAAWDRLAASPRTGFWPASFDLGPSRGNATPWDIESHTCTVTIENKKLTRPGAYLLRTTVKTHRSTEVWVRTQSSESLRLRIGGETVFLKDNRRALGPSTRWSRIRLEPGVTEIVAETISQSGMGASFSVALLPTEGRDRLEPESPSSLASARAAVLPALEQKFPELCPANLQARLAVALFHDDYESAHELAESLMGYDGPTKALGMLGAAEALEADPDLPGEMGFEAARDVYAEALRLDPRLYRATKRLASRAMDENRVREALQLLRAGRRLSPREPDLRVHLLEILAQKGWRAELMEEVRQVEALLPGACKTLAWQHFAAANTERHQLALELAQAISRCDASSTLYAKALEARGQWEKARVERERLARLPASSIESHAAVAATMAAAGHTSQAHHHLATQGKNAAPLESNASLLLADYALANGDTTNALSTLHKAATQGRAAPFDLLVALSQLTGDPVLGELRVDGSEVIQRYREQRPAYATASVLVLDRMVYLVAPDGSATSIVHTITEVRSDEAVESLGEVKLPPGARSLRLRTLKPDGRILEPEKIAFKDSLSLPDLAIGDFIELEYVTVNPPSHVVDGGFDTGRFFFRDFDSAFHQSEMVIVTPKSMQIIADPRGECPEAQTVIRGGYRVSTYRARNTTPAIQEPLAPLPHEYFPSIRVLSSTTWQDLLGDMREELGELDRPTRALRQTLEDIVADLDHNDHENRKRAIYAWVLENIQEQGGLFDPVGHILLRGQGSRARLFAVLCRMAGYQAQLGLVRSALSDATPTAAPAFDLFDRIAVVLPKEEWFCLDHPGAPYAFLPPAMRQRPALLLESETFSTTPSGCVPREERSIHMSVIVEKSGDASVLVREELTGLLAASWRDDLKSMSKQDRERQFQDGYLSDTLAAARLDSLDIQGERDLDAPLVLMYKARVTGFATRQGDKLIAKIPLGISLTQGAASTAERTTPLVLALSTVKQLEVSITGPPGFASTLSRPLGEKLSSGPFGRVEAFAFPNGPLLIAGYKAEIDIHRVAPQNYEAFALFSRETDRLTNLEVEIIPTPPQ